ncbi:hypothetical protein BB558_003331 [Smittium angustum]|uniref:RRM domain-containing protein n=1 Tax=Smittium angustum TaxID=133377 RepID=A0A2U1J6B6_SMIAN|nr:hypothetical protein BB558_003331 [Smittium angustum]
MSEEFDIEALLDAPYKNQNTTFVNQSSQIITPQNGNVLVNNTELNNFDSINDEKAQPSVTTQDLSNQNSNNVDITKQEVRNLSVENSRSHEKSERSRDPHREISRERRYSKSKKDQRSRSRSRDRRRYSDRKSRSRSKDRYRKRERSRDRNRKNKSKSRERSPVLSKFERDQRTVFVMQLSRSLTQRELVDFFSKAGKVRSAKIITDRITRKPKGIGYVEFREIESAINAVALSGQQLRGIPIIVQFSEAEKNQQAQTKVYTSSEVQNPSILKNRRVYVSRIPTVLEESDLEQVFEVFGSIEKCVFVPSESENKNHRAYIQYFDTKDADLAVEKMDGDNLLGSKIRVRLFNKYDTFPEKPLIKNVVNNNISQRSQTQSYSSKPIQGTQAAPDYQNSLSQSSTSPQINRLDSLRQAGYDVPESFSRREMILKNQILQNTEQIVSDSILLGNMFDPENETEPNWAAELQEEIGEEVLKYGSIKHIRLIPESKGEVYIKFDSVESAKEALSELNGRWFDGKQVSAKFISPVDYESKFPGF